MKAKHIIIFCLIYLLFGTSASMVYLTMLCYYLFCKGFMIHTYYPTFIESVNLTKIYGEQKADRIIEENVMDSRFKQYLQNNKQFVENRLYFLYQTNKEKYEQMVTGASGFAFIVFPIILLQFFQLKKLNRYLRSRLR